MAFSLKRLEHVWLVKAGYDVFALTLWFALLFSKTAQVYKATCSPVWKDTVCDAWISAHTHPLIASYVLPLILTAVLAFLGKGWIEKHNRRGLAGLIAFLYIHAYLSIVWFVSVLAQHLWGAVFFVFIMLPLDIFVAYKLHRLHSAPWTAGASGGDSSAYGRVSTQEDEF